MVIVSSLLLPLVAVLLYGMNRLEDWLTRTPQSPRHAHPRHLRLAASPYRAPLAAVPLVALLGKVPRGTKDGISAAHCSTCARPLRTRPDA